jgi:hypothetical protein
MILTAYVPTKSGAHVLATCTLSQDTPWVNLLKDDPAVRKRACLGSVVSVQANDTTGACFAWWPMQKVEEA